MKGTLVFAGASLLLSQSVAAGMVYDESIDGNFPHPSSGQSPVFDSRYSTIIGAVNGLQTDGFIIELADGETLEGITLTAASGPNGGSATFSMQDGITFSYPSIIDFEPWNESNIGDELLTTFGAGPISGQGSFLVALWHNNSPDISYNLELEFSVAPVPLPAAAWLFASGLFGATLFARRKTANNKSNA